VNFPYPVLVCDVGGTNARFAMAAQPGAAPGTVFVRKTADHATFESALADVWDKFTPAPRSLIVCAAGPAEGRKLKLTNAAWMIDGAVVAERFGLLQGLLLNDFEAQALSLAVLQPSDWTSIGPAFAARGGTGLVLGSGTGLGVGALVETSGRLLALPSEAGHMNLDPSTREEEILWPHIEADELGRVSAEHLLSGPGLVRLHQARQRAAGLEVPENEEAKTIDMRAQADRSSQEAQTIALYFQLLARFSGDLALAFLARGGVTFAGGIFPKLLDLLDTAAFRATFEAKAPHQAFMKKVATRLISTEAAVLAGMAAVAHDPELYLIDYQNRAWR
jgi:glucokinase